MIEPALKSVLDDFVVFLETGAVSEGLFAEDAFCDFTVPLWRLQAAGRSDVIALRHRGHPAPGHVSMRRMDPTPTGFVVEVEERWESGGETWYCRELIRADLRDGSIADLSVYCTGDWDAARVAEHAQAVTLLRP